jgi:hypothetical protein
LSQFENPLLVRLGVPSIADKDANGGWHISVPVVLRFRTNFGAFFDKLKKISRHGRHGDQDG